MARGDLQNVVGELAASQVAWGRAGPGHRARHRHRWYSWSRTGRARRGWQRTWRHVEGPRCELVFVVEDMVNIAGFLLVAKYMVLDRH